MHESVSFNFRTQVIPKNKSKTLTKDAPLELNPFSKVYIFFREHKGKDNNDNKNTRFNLDWMPYMQLIEQM